MSQEAPAAAPSGGRPKPPHDHGREGARFSATTEQHGGSAHYGRSQTVLGLDPDSTTSQEPRGRFL